MTPLFLKIEIKPLSLHIAEFYSGLARILNLRYLASELCNNFSPNFKCHNWREAGAHQSIDRPVG
jgi:hypothetical protein